MHIEFFFMVRTLCYNKRNRCKLWEFMFHFTLSTVTSFCSINMLVKYSRKDNCVPFVHVNMIFIPSQVHTHMHIHNACAFACAFDKLLIFLYSVWMCRIKILKPINYFISKRILLTYYLNALFFNIINNLV